MATDNTALGRDVVPGAVPAVHVSQLVKRYGDMVALDYFDLDVTQGEIFGLLGPNGSGKTTAINCILALLTYDSGTIRVFGQPMTPTSYALKRRIGIVPQNVAVFNELTVTENIDYFCSLYVPGKADRARWSRRRSNSSDCRISANSGPESFPAAFCGVSTSPAASRTSLT